MFVSQLQYEYTTRKWQHINEVLKEANLQYHRLNRQADVDMLAKVSTKHSSWARARARAIGLLLEQDATGSQAS